MFGVNMLNLGTFVRNVGKELHVLHRATSWGGAARGHYLSTCHAVWKQTIEKAYRRDLVAIARRGRHISRCGGKGKKGWASGTGGGDAE